MFHRVNVSIRLLAEFAASRGLVALRWGLDVVRGYERGCDARDGVRNCLRIGGLVDNWNNAGHFGDRALECLRALGEQRAERGPLGVGARLAMTPAEFVDLRVAAENLWSEALRREQQHSGERA